MSEFPHKYVKMIARPYQKSHPHNVLCVQKQTAVDIAQMQRIMQREYQNLLIESSQLEIQLSDIRYSGIGHVTKERQMLSEYDQRLKRLQQQVERKQGAVLHQLQLVNCTLAPGVGGVLGSVFPLFAWSVGASSVPSSLVVAVAVQR